MAQNHDDGTVFTGEFDQLRDSAWLSSADIAWDKDTRVQIKEIREHHNLKLQNETKGKAGSVVFVGAKKALLMNAGHRTVLKMLFGNAKRAQGGWIALFVDPEVESFGKIVSAVRIRARRIDPPGKSEPRTPGIADERAVPPDDPGAGG